MAAAVVADPVSVPTSLGAREVLDLAGPLLNLQKVENPQVSIHQCSTRYGSQALRSLFEKLVERGTTSSFEEINLADNTIGDEGAAYLQKGLSGNSSLKRLTMPRAGVGAEGFKALGKLLADSPALESLVLSSNICDAAGVEGEFCSGLEKNKSLKSLVLAACRIGDKGVEKLCAGPLRNHPALEHVCLTYNRLEAATAKSVNQVLAVNKKLRYLDLCGNSLGPEGAELLVEGLKANKGHLTQLGLAQNGIRLKGARALCKHFLSAEGSSLVYLDLRHNSVTYRGMVELRDGILGKPMDGPEGWMLLFDGDKRQLLINAL
mmetsp:Transcript_34753/g.103886  ORF Transcript_34753/g.103886 Transcript_34753/m.103886 type:complete len:320 (-) Transcript_34753:61-1020(-)